MPPKLDEVGTAEQQEAAKNIGTRLRDLGCMIDDMVRFAAGTQQPGEVVQVADLLRDVADTVAAQLKSGSQLKIEVMDSGLSVLANRAALKGALMNLVTNAAQASIGSPVIELCAVRSHEQICLTVTDDGPGVREDIRSRLFDPFFHHAAAGHRIGSGSGAFGSRGSWWRSHARLWPSWNSVFNLCSDTDGGGTFYRAILRR